MGIMSAAPAIVELDAASLARLAALMNASAIFVPFYTAAMNASVQRVITESKKVASTSFGHSRSGYVPQGKLMGAIRGKTISPWRGVAGVGREIPYARRREYGFSGMTDALGRYYPDDPGAFYMHKGLEASRGFIRAAYTGATLSALKAIAL